MALRIRLKQQGRLHKHTYRIVVVDSRTKRDGDYVECLGWYNPHLTSGDVSLDGERLDHWLQNGAIPSESVVSLAERTAPDVMERERQRAKSRLEKARLQQKKRRAAARTAA